PQVQRAAFATFITGFQMHMAHFLMGLIDAGVLERHPTLQVVIGEAGIGWIPYVLEHMDLEWEDQFQDLALTLKPSDYWRRQCKATYQTDPIGIELLEHMGAETIMWGSDFPHPDGVWPDSQEFIQRELGHVPEGVRRQIVCENAARLYGFPLE
ncbi:MAG TPA: amidohydrolase family protein, partial [Longimicrobiales bacterium]|nr:amidohydrolase family protein [Longimicrobiales bacterium]